MGFFTDFPHQEAGFEPSWTLYANIISYHFLQQVGVSSEQANFAPSPYYTSSSRNPIPPQIGFQTPYQPTTYSSYNAFQNQQIFFEQPQRLQQ